MMVCLSLKNKKFRDDEQGFRTGEGNINNMYYANDSTLMAKNVKDLQALVIKVKKVTK